MKKLIIILAISLLFLTQFNRQAYSQGDIEREKLAQTGMKFLQVSVDARASALSSAMASMEVYSTALFYNPASMSRLRDFAHVSLGSMQWIADINYFYGSMAIAPQNGRFGVFGFSALSVDYGSFQGTILANNEQGFLDTQKFSPTAFSFGMGYAKSLTDKFSVGGQIKYVKQNLTGGVTNFDEQQSLQADDLSADVMAVDFGILYKTGFRSLNFGMNVRNFSQEIEYYEESFQLPLTFKMGLSMDMMDLMDVNPKQHTLILSVDASHPRDYTEQIDVGTEYIFMNTFAFRMGYTAPTDEQQINMGAGFRQSLVDFELSVDYAYTPFGIFNEVHRFTLQFMF